MFNIINECLIDSQKLNHQGKIIDDIVAEINAALINVLEEKYFLLEVLEVCKYCITYFELVFSTIKFI